MANEQTFKTLDTLKLTVTTDSQEQQFIQKFVQNGPRRGSVTEVRH